MKRLACVMILIMLLFSGCAQPLAEQTAMPEVAYVGGDPHLYHTDHGLGRMADGVLPGKLTLRQRQLIVAYLDLYYESLSVMERQDMSLLFAEGPSLAWNNALLDYQLAQRRLQPQDLSLTKWSYTAEVIAVEQAAGTLTVEVTEDSEQYFAAYPEIKAERYASWHLFTLTEHSGQWYIGGHIDSLQESYRSYYPETEEMTAEALAAHFAGLELSAIFAQWGAPCPIGEERACTHLYDRQRAVDYALTRWRERDPNWADFSGRGGNCQNYASQCLLAGGIPMDEVGPAVWHSIPGEPYIDHAEGRSTSWAGVVSFTKYAAENSGYGLCAATDRPYYSGNVGDLLQMGLTEPAHHATVITQVITDGSGNTTDYLLCSNTANLKNYPASAYPYPYRTLIRIYGWNGQ